MTIMNIITGLNIAYSFMIPALIAIHGVVSPEIQVYFNLTGYLIAILPVGLTVLQGIAVAVWHLSHCEEGPTLQVEKPEQYAPT